MESAARAKGIKELPPPSKRRTATSQADSAAASSAMALPLPAAIESFGSARLWSHLSHPVPARARPSSLPRARQSRSDCSRQLERRQRDGVCDLEGGGRAYLGGDDARQECVTSTDCFRVEEESSLPSPSRCHAPLPRLHLGSTRLGPSRPRLSPRVSY
jgi:hypothetical protein